MNELTYLLAILVKKDVLTAQEALALQKAATEGVISPNLGEMIAKVDKALSKKQIHVEKIDARTLLNRAQG